MIATLKPTRQKAVILKTTAKSVAPVKVVKERIAADELFSLFTANIIKQKVPFTR
jgi:hypothetical protein